MTSATSVEKEEVVENKDQDIPYEYPRSNAYWEARVRDLADIVGQYPTGYWEADEQPEDILSTEEDAFDANGGNCPDYSDTEATTQDRVFDTGAARSSVEGKVDLEGCLSPLALMEYGKYMLAAEMGGERVSDNWQLGVPLDSYMKSMFRHFHAVWLKHRGHQKGDIITDLMAMWFNVQGYAHEVLKKRNEPITATEVKERNTDYIKGFIDRSSPTGKELTAREETAERHMLEADKLIGEYNKRLRSVIKREEIVFTQEQELKMDFKDFPKTPVIT